MLNTHSAELARNRFDISPYDYVDAKKWHKTPKMVKARYNEMEIIMIR